MKIGIDLGGTNVRVALVDERGIVKVIKEPCKADKSVEETMDHIKSMIHQIIIPSVTAIGIGVPSAVDPEKGIVYNVTNIPSWKEVHIKETLEEEFKIPVFVNNDANCFVLGEKYYGSAKPYKNIVGVSIGTGMGAGIIINNELYGGTNTCAGEIGCLPYLDYTYEDYCASNFFKRFHQTTGVEAFNAAKNGDEKALNIWEEFGEHIGSMICMVLFTYDPQAIVFGGSIASAYNLFAPSMHRRLESFLFPKMVEKLAIHTSQSGDISILGAASLVQDIS